MRALFIASLFVAVGAFGQMHHGVPKGTKGVITCAVTGDKVDMAKAMGTKLYADFKGNRYFFCCADCPPKFKKNPAKYASKPHIKTPWK